MAKNGNQLKAHSNGWAAALILIGVAYVLQQNEIFFQDITLWPWVMVAVGVVALIHKKFWGQLLSWAYFFFFIMTSFINKQNNRINMWFAKTIKNMKLWDISLLKLSVFFFAFFIASFINAELIQQYRWIWLTLGIIFMIKPLALALRHM